jgi:hypothetical protein
MKEGPVVSGGGYVESVIPDKAGSCRRIREAGESAGKAFSPGAYIDLRRSRVESPVEDRIKPEPAGEILHLRYFLIGKRLLSDQQGKELEASQGEDTCAGVLDTRPGKGVEERGEQSQFRPVRWSDVDADAQNPSLGKPVQVRRERFHCQTIVLTSSSCRRVR